MDARDLSDFFKTKTQANDFSSRIAAISEMIYTTDFSLEKALEKHLGLEKKDKFLALLQKNEVNKTATPALKEFFEKTQEAIKSTPTTPLTIAFEPREQTLTMLSDWFLLHMNKHVIFDITVDPSLIAGAAITFNGKYFDFSVKQQFEQIVKTAIEDSVTPVKKTEETPQKEHHSLEHLHVGR